MKEEVVVKKSMKKMDAPRQIETSHGQIDVVEVARRYLPPQRSNTRYHRDTVELTEEEIGTGAMVPIYVTFQWDRKYSAYDQEPHRIWRWVVVKDDRAPQSVKEMKQAAKKEAAKKPTTRKPAAKKDEVSE